MAYNEEQLPHPSIRQYGQIISDSTQKGCAQRGLPLPHLQLEPGRSLVARQGGALSRWSSEADIQSPLLLLDGGMADNPRPPMYKARYSALPVSDPLRPIVGAAWLQVHTARVAIS